jgi:glycosyltransferase involved in cell wall biosynthesis
MKKRVLIFSLSYYPTFVSGAEAAVKEITDRISPEDIEFHLVTLRFDSTLPKEERVGNVFVHRIGFTKPKPTFEDLGKWPLDLNKPLFQFAAAWTGLRLHRQKKIDAIWALMAHSAGVPAALFKLVQPSVPYLLTLQEGDPPERIERVMRLLWPLFSRAFTQATIVQAISTFLADWARRRGYAGPIEIIHNGANPKDLHETVSDQDIEAARRAINKQPGEIVLMNTARLVHQKGHDTVIRALELLPKNVRLVLVGDGPDEADLKRLSEELHLTARVQFTGRVDRSQVTAYRKNADIFVGPSRSEGLGNAFLSAMASRLPVVATQVGGIADFLFDAKRNPDTEPTGWAVDPDQPQQIADAANFILTHPDDVQRVTAHAREMVLRSYDWDKIASDMHHTIFDRLWKTTSV